MPPLAEVQAINWTAIFGQIRDFINKYGVQAVPYIENWLATLSLPAWILPILDALVETLLGGQKAAKLDAGRAQCAQ